MSLNYVFANVSLLSLISQEKRFSVNKDINIK